MLSKTPPMFVAAIKTVTQKKFFFRAAFFVSLLFVFISCVTTNPYSQIDNLVEKEDFTQSIDSLERHNRNIYRDRDSVLYFLDRGMLAHYNGNYEESTELLQQGERKIEENFTVSITQEIGTYILNDRVKEYEGEDYEDIYLNLFNALNYYQLGNLEGALVEIRRMNNKLRDLSVKYGQLMTNIQQMALENNTEIPPNPGASIKFNNSALARYIGMLFYRGYGLIDDARIDQNQLRIAMADAPQIYKNPVPSSIREELHIPYGMARFNVIGFAGLSPVKTEEIIRIWIRNAWIKIALPVMTPRPSRINSIDVIFDSGEHFTLELLEDLGEVINATFSQKKSLIYAKSVIRASIKGIAASVFFDAARHSRNEKGLFAMLGLGSQMLAEATERADLRAARYLPGKAYVGGINLKPGTYSYTIIYYGQKKRRIAEYRFENVIIRADALNLTEVICLR